MEKETWRINAHGFESGNAASLDDCYRCAVKVTHTSSVMFILLKRLNGMVEIKSSGTLRKYFSVFVGATTQSVEALPNHTDKKATSLLGKGEFENEEAVLRPVDISDMPATGDDESTNSSGADMTLDVVRHNPSFAISREH